jgi:D-serine deaminase-like pyridoxal phosphate-dependent protein
MHCQLHLADMLYAYAEVSSAIRTINLHSTRFKAVKVCVDSLKCLQPCD